MKTLTFYYLGTMLVLFSFNSYAGSVETAGGHYNASLTWCADTIKITGNVTVKGTINICPGTYVKFMGNYGIIADELIAHGTMSDSIIFSINDTIGNYNRDITNGGWIGLLAKKNLNMCYCRVEYIKNLLNLYGVLANSPFGSISISDSYTVELKHSSFRHNFVKYAQSLVVPSVLFYVDIDSNHFDKNINYFTINLGSAERCTGPGIRYNRFINNKGSAITITSNCGITPITGNTIENNSGWGIFIEFIKGDAKINNNIISNNQNGGILIDGDRTTGDQIIEISNNIIKSNFKDGGIEIGFCHPIITNNLIYNNKSNFSGFGGGINIGFCSALLVNNTISNNYAFNGGGIFLDNSSVNIYNCIIRDNNADAGPQIVEFRSGTREGLFNYVNGDLVNSNIEGLNIFEVNGIISNNIDQNPLFVDSLNSDFHLRENSPCINTGRQDTTGLKLPATDLDGNPRIMDLYVDMGAYEYHNDTLKILLQLEGFSANAGEKRQLKTNSTGGILGYQWQKEGDDLPNENSNTLQFAPIQISDAGHYNCKIFSSGGTVSTDTVLVTVSLPNGLPNDRSLIELKAYPNPTTGVVFLKFSSGMHGALPILVTDLEGKVIVKKYIGPIAQDTTYPVDLSMIEDGVYILMIDKSPIRIIKNSWR